MTIIKSVVSPVMIGGVRTAPIAEATVRSLGFGRDSGPSLSHVVS